MRATRWDLWRVGPEKEKREERREEREERRGKRGGRREERRQKTEEKPKEAARGPKEAARGPQMRPPELPLARRHGRQKGSPLGVVPQRVDAVESGFDGLMQSSK